MSRQERLALIQEIEQSQSSKVICYITGDRNPTPAQIGDDAVRPMFDHLRSLGHVDKVDLFIYSRGGAIDVPWRIVTALRRTATEWRILIPFRANSAATLIALGADEIVMGRNGELGPIDPQVNFRRFINQQGGGGTAVQDQVAVEDVLAYLHFAETRGGLSDQAALAASLGKLSDRLDPVALGSVYRTHSHIRDVARRMLLNRKKPPNEQAMATIVESLAEKVYAHGHAIGSADATALGLPVVVADDDLDARMWSLLKLYEQDLRLLEHVDPVTVTANADLYQEPGVIAVVESGMAVDEFKGQVEIRVRRQMPANLGVTLNLNLQLPPGLTPQGLPPAIQQMIQQAQQGLLAQAQQALQAALQAQAPIQGIDAAFRGGRWVRSN